MCLNKQQTCTLFYSVKPISFWHSYISLKGVLTNMHLVWFCQTNIFLPQLQIIKEYLNKQNHVPRWILSNHLLFCHNIKGCPHKHVPCLFNSAKPISFWHSHISLKGILTNNKHVSSSILANQYLVCTLFYSVWVKYNL